MDTTEAFSFIAHLRWYHHRHDLTGEWLAVHTDALHSILPQRHRRKSADTLTPPPEVFVHQTPVSGHGNHMVFDGIAGLRWQSRTVLATKQLRHTSKAISGVGSPSISQTRSTKCAASVEEVGNAKTVPASS